MVVEPVRVEAVLVEAGSLSRLVHSFQNIDTFDKTSTATLHIFTRT